MLVQVTEDSIQERKEMKNWNNSPLMVDDTKLWEYEAEIRSALNTVDWLRNAPHGSIYFNEDGSIL